MAYIIPLEFDGKPPFRPLYQFNPLELQEAKKAITKVEWSVLNNQKD